MSRAEDLGLDIEYQEEKRAQAMENMKDALWEEFNMSYTDSEILKEMADDDPDIMIEMLGDEYDEFKHIMFEEYCETRS